MRYKLSSIEDCQEVLRRCLREYTTESEEDDDRSLAIKRALRSLPADEQALFILETEIGSYRKLAKIFGVSRTTILNKVQEIKNKIKRRL